MAKTNTASTSLIYGVAAVFLIVAGSSIWTRYAKKEIKLPTAYLSMVRQRAEIGEGNMTSQFVAVADIKEWLTANSNHAKAANYNIVQVQDADGNVAGFMVGYRAKNGTPQPKNDADKNQISKAKIK